MWLRRAAAVNHGIPSASNLRSYSRAHSSILLRPSCLSYKVGTYKNSAFYGTETTARPRKTHDGSSSPSEQPAKHEDLDIDQLVHSRYLNSENISKTQEQLLAASLREFLPADEEPEKCLQSWPLLGHQQVHFRPHLTKVQVLPDGTDVRFLPGSAEKWPYRLWAGGSVSLLNPPGPWNPMQEFVQRETVEDYRVVGKSAPERVFVTVRKEIGPSDVTGTPPIPQGDDYEAKPLLVETYTLCFLRKLPGLSANAKTIKPPSEALYTHTMRPNFSLLFQFSALTHNAHRIHLDPSYAQSDYGMRSGVVHGPLLMVLMLDFLRISLQGFPKEPGRTRLLCKHIDYRNYAPLYVDESFTLCCKPSKSKDIDDPAQAREWQVWIQTGSGDEASLAVRGKVEVTTFPE